MVIVVGPKVPNPRRGTQTWCLHWQRLGARPWPQERIVRLRVPVATQTAPALSSRVAEFVAQVKWASVRIEMQSVARDPGRSDSTPIRQRAKGISSGVGLSKVRLLDTTFLKIQQHVSRWNLQIHKSCRTREQGGQGREGRRRRDALETDESHEFRGSVGTTPAISESRFGWRGN